MMLAALSRGGGQHAEKGNGGRGEEKSHAGEPDCVGRVGLKVTGYNFARPICEKFHKLNQLFENQLFNLSL
jgi:hypothetical protein